MKCDSAFISAMGIVCAAATTDAQTILRVDCTASDAAPDGSTWAQAYPHLQTALAAAAGIAGPGNPVQIRVAECTYMPDGGYTMPGGAHTAGSGDRNATFQLLNNVEVYGGFPTGGGDGTFDARDPSPETNGTVLSGDLHGDDHQNFINNDENSYHVATGNATDATAVLSGFTITAGNANGGDVGRKRGAGINTRSGGPTITNCTITRNSTAMNPGGGITAASSRVAITNSILWANIAPTASEITLWSSSVVSVSHTDLQGAQASVHVGNGATLLWGGGNVNAAPLFADANGADNISGTTDDDLRLLRDSPCVNAGDNTADIDANTPSVQPLPPIDLDGNPRIMGSAVDMGAYERTAPIPQVPVATGWALAVMAMLLVAITVVYLRRTKMVVGSVR